MCTTTEKESPLAGAEVLRQTARRWEFGIVEPAVKQRGYDDALPTWRPEHRERWRKLTTFSWIALMMTRNRLERARVDWSSDPGRGEGGACRCRSASRLRISSIKMLRRELTTMDQIPGGHAWAGPFRSRRATPFGETGLTGKPTRRTAAVQGLRKSCTKSAGRFQGRRAVHTRGQSTLEQESPDKDRRSRGRAVEQLSARVVEPIAGKSSLPSQALIQRPPRRDEKSRTQ